MFPGTTITSPAGSIEVSILIEGNPQLLYQPPSGRAHVAGVPGKSYKLRVRNLTSRRVEIITAVDGRNTLKDEPADHTANRGLVVAAHSRGEFSGWRLNDTETREFIFGTPERSVTAQATGSAANTGVLGFATYREREWASTAYGGGNIATASAAIFDYSGPMTPRGGGLQSSLGTGIGERREDRVGRTDFIRTQGAPDILVIGYDTEEVLRERGIIGPAEPVAFPGLGTGYERYASQ